MCLTAFINFTSADTIQGINIDFVTIGNAGNVADTSGTVGRGAVSYDYRIGKYEITNAQWNTFTAASGAPNGNEYNTHDPYDRSAYYTGSQQPANNVSWFEALQFCNYLTSGDKSKGAYLFSGNNANAGDFLGIDRNAAIAAYGSVYVLPTENEWYKAAYFKPDANGYSLYANGTSTAPSTIEACYGQSYPYAGPWDVGSSAIEQNGTFDMMGNVFEWDELQVGSAFVESRGGSFERNSSYFMSSVRDTAFPSRQSIEIGFRVVVIPEPATILLLTLGGLLLRKK